MAKHRVTREPVVQPRNKNIKLVPLTKGQVAVVDARDYERVMALAWNAQWHPRVKGYYARAAHGGPLMHRFILRLSDPQIKVDHWDGNGLNNRRKNLRHADDSKNAQNRKVRSDSASGYTGIHWRKDMRTWQVNIFTRGKRKHLGYHKEWAEAVRIRLEAEKKYFGKFALSARHKTP